MTTRCISGEAVYAKESREAVLPLEGEDRSKVSVEDDASHKRIAAIWKDKQTNKTAQQHIHRMHTGPAPTFRNLCLILPDWSMDRASRCTEIFSSEVLTQSSIPLQLFMENVKLELVVVGRFWMLRTERDTEWERGALSPRSSCCFFFFLSYTAAKDVLVVSVMCDQSCHSPVNPARTSPSLSQKCHTQVSVCLHRVIQRVTLLLTVFLRLIKFD